MQEKRGLFKKKTSKLQHSMDDSHVEAQKYNATLPLRRQASETNLGAEFMDKPSSGAKSQHPKSLMDKFSDVSKSIIEKQGPQSGSKRAKSPFSIFKRPKSREPSPLRGPDLRGPGTLPVRITVCILDIRMREDRFVPL